MTIDTNELRRLAQAATPGHWQFWHGWVAADIDNDGGVIIVERPTPSGGKYQARVDNNFKFIAAANPATINELLDRLEEAESDALEQARLNGIGAERELALMAKLEAAEKAVNEAYQRGYETGQEEIEKERDDVAQQLVQSEIGKREISEAHDAVTGRLSDLADENTALRAKIAGMDRQEPSAPEFCPCCGNIMRACMICPNEDCNAVTATAEQSKYNKQHALARKASGAAAPEAKP